MFDLLLPFCDYHASMPILMLLILKIGYSCDSIAGENSTFVHLMEQG
jgi:hypothetical protein